MDTTMRRLLGVALLCSLGGLCGCPSYMLMQSTRTTRPGHIEVSAAAGAETVGVGNAIASATGSAMAPPGMPDTSFQARVGIVKNFDIGVRFRPLDLGVGIDMKIRFLDLPHLRAAIGAGADTSLIWSLVNLAASLVPDSPLKGLFIYHLRFPLLFGTPLGDGKVLLFGGPRFDVTNWSISAILDTSGAVGVSQLSYLPGLTIGGELASGKKAHLLAEIDAFYDPGTGSFAFEGALSASFEL